jgi:hypothetical protein
MALFSIMNASSIADTNTNASRTTQTLNLIDLKCWISQQRDIESHTRYGSWIRANAFPIFSDFNSSNLTTPFNVSNYQHFMENEDSSSDVNSEDSIDLKQYTATIKSQCKENVYLHKKRVNYNWRELNIWLGEKCTESQFFPGTLCI